MTDLTMPKLSDSMEEGTILKWLKQDGDDVAAGEDLVEIETDKATMTHAADAAGVLTLLAAEGESLPVGAPIARVAPAGVAPAPAAAPEPAASAPVPAAPAPEPQAAGAVAVAAPANGVPGASAVRASPLARRLAAQHELDLGQVTGTGPFGRITRGDVAAAAGIAEPPPAATAAAAPAPAVAPATAQNGRGEAGAKGAVTEQPLTRLQQVIARRMAETKATVPEFQVQTEVAMDAAIALRGQLKVLAGDEPAPSFNDLIVRAAAVALRDHPRANGSYRDGTFLLHERVNVGVAVAADDALVVPTVFDADTKSLGQIARDVRRLAERVRGGEITPPELSGGTFTVSNLGMYGMTAITPVINGTQAAILGVGAMREVLAREDGEIVDRTLLTLTLSCDHRILYGADAARFLARIRELLEAPLRLAL